MSAPTILGERAEVLQDVLWERFWSPRQQLFRAAEGRRLSPLRQWHPWWQAQALTALLDRRDRTGDDLMRRRADDLVEGMRRRGRGTLINDFCDDMGWLALALLRMPGSEADLAQVMAAIRRGAMPEGGVAWSVKHPEFRNVAATGPAAIAALVLADRDDDAELRGWGWAQAGWLRATLVGSNGEVADGLRVHPGGGPTIETNFFSYNYGLVVGVELALHALSGDPACLVRASLVARAGLQRLTDPATGIWRTEGIGGRALFRGIFARHLAELALRTGAPDLVGALRTQADAIWVGAGGGPVGATWGARPTGPVELSDHVSAVHVLEAVARLG